ncbi:DUF2378 family protein [Hyalangium rubrum]|uniref:DUF2378 family protein n=1 Tax=Hyalangium rubrum TaxID=3103134 RepID=A0ABU5GY42_9BACT|nr:DUF2378 family protein [Hyalangium sp. s54d21]MDY7225961.1 DUF2378 family protein [Hyalangium sp. s54d21]
MHVQSQATEMGAGLNTEAHLERNMALAMPDDTARGMFFNGALEVVRSLAGEEVARLCHQSTGERRKHVDFFRYPVASFLKLCLTAVRHVGPRLGGCEATLRWVGEQSSRDFLTSMAGKTVLVLAGGSVKRVLAQVPSSYRAAVSYGERTLVCDGQRGRMVIKHDFMPPAYHEGTLRGTLLAAGAKTIHVQGQSTGLLDSEYEFSWE